MIGKVERIVVVFVEVDVVDVVVDWLLGSLEVVGTLLDRVEGDDVELIPRGIDHILIHS